MNNFLSSKVFVIISTVFTFIIGMIAGWLLAYQPSTSGSVSGWSSPYGGSTSGHTATEFIFQIKTACGYWLIAIMITFVVLLLCLIIRKKYQTCTAKTEIQE